MELKSTPQLKRLIYNQNGNIVYQLLNGISQFSNCKTILTKPLIIDSDQGRIIIVASEKQEIPEDCVYALLNSRKLKITDFDNGKLKITKWLKHPQLNNDKSEDISKSWANLFHYKKENPKTGELGLRPPQIGAIHSIMSHIENADQKGVIVLPTGTGKTETMISTMVANQCEKVLVSVPSDSLRNQISESFASLGILRKLGVVPNEITNPIIGVITKKFKTEQEYKSFISQCNVVISTIHILAGLPIGIQKKIANDFTHYFVDEAHHSEAPSWKSFIDLFSPEKVFLFTATPFRNDNKKLDGKIIFNFSLKKAQEQGYYKNINFIAIREYNKEDADIQIAEKAIECLKQDLANGYDHILMARCKTKSRAEEIFEHYSKFTEFSPIIVYNGLSGLGKRIEDIKKKKHQVIICVDMLGEGFDLPELKIAAIHDERQSIPIMLQFIGRFTRTSSAKIGDATFVTNTAYPPIKEELNQLYNSGSDWNVLLPKFSDGITQKQVSFNEFLEGFNNAKESQIPFHSIQPAMSVVTFINNGNSWYPENWKMGIPYIKLYEHQFSNINQAEKTLVIILGKTVDVDWGSFDVAKNLNWEMITIHWDYRPKDRNLIFVSTSIKNLNYSSLLKSIFGEYFLKIEGDQVFRVLDGIQRYLVFNFGGRKGIGRDISFQTFFGKNVEEGLHELEQRKLEKNNVFGTGYRNGESISMGCSQKGKIWSYLRGNLKELIEWCQEVGTKLIDESIDTEIILSKTIRSQTITKRPSGKTPVYIDWHPEMYSFEEGKYEFINVFTSQQVDLSDCELNIIATTEDKNLTFEWSSSIGSAIYELELGEFDDSGTLKARYEFKKVSGQEIQIKVGNQMPTNLASFFYENSPVIYFNDTSFLYKTKYTIPKDPIPDFDTSKFIEEDWSNVDISKESMGFDNPIQDSIQYHFLKKLESQYEILINDDGSGEMADIIGINRVNDVIKIDLFHLKYAKEGKITARIDNFYEVCGQAQKSLSWKHSESVRIFNHIFRRLKGNNRIFKGDENLLEEIKENARFKMEVSFKISIVQPGVSKSKMTDSILSLLANTSYFLKTTGNVDLSVYINKG